MTEFPIVDENDIVRATPSADTVLELLANDRRRAIVAALDRHDENWMRVETLVERLSTTFETTEWKIELHHVHLPMLDDEGLVEYDDRNGTVRYYDCELVTDVLTAVERHAIG